MKPEDKLTEAIAELEYLQIKEGVQFTSSEILQIKVAVKRLEYFLTIDKQENRRAKK